MQHFRWMNAENTILQVHVSENHFRIVEPDAHDWLTLSQRPDIVAYTPPPPLSAEQVLDAERARMVCSPAQMRLALHRMGLLKTVQAIASADAEASIVWEYATQIVRRSPFIDALGGANGFTPAQIDDIFRQAMQVQT